MRNLEGVDEPEGIAASGGWWLVVDVEAEALSIQLVMSRPNQLNSSDTLTSLIISPSVYQLFISALVCTPFVFSSASIQIHAALDFAKHAV